MAYIYLIELFWGSKEMILGWSLAGCLAYRKRSIHFISSRINSSIISFSLLMDHLGFLHSSVGKESACNEGDPSWIPGLGRSTGEGIGDPLQYSWAFLVAQWVKNRLQCRRTGFDPWVRKIPWRRERLPTPVFWPGEFHGLYRPWGRKESRLSNWVTFTSLDHLILAAATAKSL